MGSQIRARRQAHVEGGDPCGCDRQQLSSPWRSRRSVPDPRRRHPSTPAPGRGPVHRSCIARSRSRRSSPTPASGAPQPILVSGASAYRGGEFLYQDFLYDDHGADGHVRDPATRAPRGDTFSRPNGHLHLPDRPRLREQRRRPRRAARQAARRRDRLPGHAQHAEGRRRASPPRSRSAARRRRAPFPHGANVSAPAELFLTVHGTTADLLDAATGRPWAPRRRPSASTRRAARSRCACRTPPGTRGSSVVRLAAGVGPVGRRGRPLPACPAGRGRDAPGRRRATARTPPAFFNVAFRFDEPMPGLQRSRVGTSANPAWWRDRAQAHALRSGDISPFHADVDFAKLARGHERRHARPARRRAAERADEPHPRQPLRDRAGRRLLDRCCGQRRRDCKGELRGQLQPYAIYVPRKPRPAAGYGLTLLLHSLGANYNQFSGSQQPVAVRRARRRARS